MYHKTKQLFHVRNSRFSLYLVKSHNRFLVNIFLPNGRLLSSRFFSLSEAQAYAFHMLGKNKSDQLNLF